MLLKKGTVDKELLDSNSKFFKSAAMEILYK